MKRLLIYMLTGMTLMSTSCSDFLDTIPRDALSPATTWQTEDDAQKFLVGCYDGWVDDGAILYWDCGSDLGYNNFIHEGWRLIGNGGMSAGNQVTDLYKFSLIRRCNDFLTNIEGLEFSDVAKKNDMIGQVKTIRAFQYFDKNWWYGGIPIIDSYTTADEAKVARNTEEEVKQFVYNELDAAIPLLKETPSARGYIAKGTALALKMRSALYYGDYERAREAAKAIIDMGAYELEPDYSKLFLLEGQDSKEIIAAVQRDANLYSTWRVGTMYNNADGGWSSMVPTQNLVDLYEMNNGLTKEETGSGYDSTHPFANRDPRMAMTVLFPGQDWNDGILNTLDATLDGVANPNNPSGVDNASKTALTWAKYLGTNGKYYPNKWATNTNVIVFRYAEVLLSYVETENELNGPSAEIYNILNRIRGRAGMPEVDQAKYNTQAKLRELIRRERSVELAGEGLRRADILRWKDESGKILAETVLNQQLTRMKGTIDYNESDPYKRAVVTGTEFIENRIYKSHNRYLPIKQTALDKNPNLKQNTGY